MQKITIQKITIIIITILAIIMTSTYSLAKITPGQVKGEIQDDIDLDFMDKIADAIQFVGGFIAVGALMIIGIKYVMGSIEEKATYKKSMMPFVIGCFVLFGASIIAPQIKEIFTNAGSDPAELGNTILGIIRIVGSVATVGALMIIGIKYMTGSIEQKAEYKKSMLPYAIGVVLIFAALQITTIIYNFTMNSTK